MAVFYKQGSEYSVSTGNNTSINGGVSQGDGNLGVSVGRSESISTTQPGVTYIPVAIIRGPGVSDLVFGDNSIVEFRNNIQL